MKLIAPACTALLSVACFAGSPTIGERLNTENAPSDIRLDSGVAVHLAARSTGTIFNDHAVLEHGAAHIGNFLGYEVQAGPLRIKSETPETQMAIRIEEKRIQIASIGGDLNVSDGMSLLTRVSAGTRMSFQNSGATQPAQTGASRRGSKVNLKTWGWVVLGIAAAALAIGLTAVAQGKSL
jgi:hypothetical protein